MSLLHNDHPFLTYTVRHLIKANEHTETYRIAAPAGDSYFLKLFRTELFERKSLTGDGEPREIAICRRLDHPSIIRFREAGCIELEGERLHYMITDYLHGELIAEHLERTGRLQVPTAVQITLRILDGLEYLHTCRPPLTHNDITERNILFGPDELGALQPRIIDMGHASAFCNGSAPFPTADLDDRYRAPETFLGIYDASTDLFSVGVLLFRMLFGRLPWDCDLENCDAARRKALVREARKRPLEEEFRLDDADLRIPPHLIRVLKQALSLGGSLRFASADEFRRALREEDDPKQAASAAAPHDLSCDEAPQDDNPMPEPVHGATFRQGHGRGFADVAGMTDLKEYLNMKVINILRNREKARRYRLSIPNGMLLYGPPGCGKTFLAEKFAEEAGFAYTVVCASELASSFVHGSQQKIGSLFAEARKKAPAVLCFDEFDALVPDRRALDHAGQSGEVNEFLSQLNNCGRQNIFVIATSNRPEKIDPAILRTGRIDRMVYVPAPDRDARRGLFALNLQDRPCSEDIDLDELAALTENHVASDIAYLVNDAATTAAFADVPISREILLAALRDMRPSISRETMAEYDALRTRIEQGGSHTERPRIGYRR